MTPDRMRWCLAHIGWSQHALARRLGVREDNVRQMARGARAVPPPIADWLEALGACHAARPLPDGWHPPAPASADADQAADAHA
jgi:DNA-binding transcriptional regulator YdaS (Cro superfamily)